ncbi:DUF2515 domain-containing protein [Bacillus salitolerans]|uniref:DUF2515 domain-containing protein n=1 Tax=Bacillus salitolerans TaxID=1437434 RepID=A0ABW4LWF7_9BACI
MGVRNIFNEEVKIINCIKEKTREGNIDNITRTKAYEDFYKQYKEIKWSFLASMVSRNAGWSMGDLQGSWLPRVLSQELRRRLFLTYERANWLIFSDAFPQLCLYAASKKLNRPLFHLLPIFHVSPFMVKEWMKFWESHDQTRLLYSLIINEQNVIQKPVIEHPVYRRRVFHTWLFFLQDRLHFSFVLFPTLSGELYGLSVHEFWKLDSRIRLGKRLANLLFDPSLYSQFAEFSLKVDHSGSRHDYEKYVYKEKVRDTPRLREAFTVVPHSRDYFFQWSATKRQINKWLKHEKLPKQVKITNWYMKKQEQLHTAVELDEYLLHLLKAT